MDGYETTRKIRSLPGKYYQEVPVLAVSASTPNTSSEKFEKAGMNGYILKPINPEKMYKTLAKYTGKKMQDIPKVKKSSPANGMAFLQLDDLYKGKEQEYRDLLKVMKKQFENDKALLIKAILEKNDTGVSKIRHRALGSLATLQQHDFIHFLQDIQDLGQRKESETQEIATHVFHRFDEILTLIKHKFITLQPHPHNPSISS
jgi:CheY-like chemotaxis protein